LKQDERDRAISANALVDGFDPERAIGATHWRDRHVASAAATIAPSVFVATALAARLPKDVERPTSQTFPKYGSGREAVGGRNEIG
jgi:hypothetical protein